MLNNLGLGFVFTARDLASAKMSALEKRFSSLDDRVTGGTERITGSFRQLGIGLGIFTAGAATVAGAFALADMAGKFEQSVAAVAAVSGASAKELALLKDAAIEAGIATQYSPTEATVGLRELAQAGFNAQESIKLLTPVLDLAAGSLGELTPQAAAGLSQLYNRVHQPRAYLDFGCPPAEFHINIYFILTEIFPGYIDEFGGYALAV